MNVVWIIADTLRKDHLGRYGNKAMHTPAIDALSEKSVRFERHYSASFPTMPARADFYTGKWSGCFMKWAPLDPKQVTLPMLLQRNGILTGAVVDTPFYMRNGMNYDRGFTTFTEVAGQHNPLMPAAKDVKKGWRSEADYFPGQTFGKAAEWVERHYKENFFLYVDTWDPHEPWETPTHFTELYYPNYDGENLFPPYNYWQTIPGYTEEKLKKAHALYCGEVTMVDTWVGYLLRKLENAGLMDNTAVIFTTDHGFYFGEHGGMFGKKIFAQTPKSPSTEDIFEVISKEKRWERSPLYEEIVNCPLIMYIPGTKPGVSSGLTSAIDLMPTVLDLMGVDKPDWVEGNSLMPMVKDNSLKGREFVVSGEPFANPGEITRAVDDRERRIASGSETTITTEEWSLIYHMEPGKSWLYNLKDDPKQEKNVIKENPDIARKLHGMLVKFMEETNLPAELREPRMELRI